MVLSLNNSLAPIVEAIRARKVAHEGAMAPLEFLSVVVNTRLHDYIQHHA